MDLLKSETAMSEMNLKEFCLLAKLLVREAKEPTTKYGREDTWMNNIGKNAKSWIVVTTNS